MQITIVNINLRKKVNIRTRNLSIRTSMSGASKNHYNSIQIIITLEDSVSCLQVLNC